MIQSRPTTGYKLKQQPSSEQVLQHDERLDHFAGLMHDLRNPLNVAKGHLTLAEEETDSDQEIQVHLSAVDRALDRIDEVIEDVLALTWGKQDLEGGDVETLDLETVAETSWEHVETADATLRVEGTLLVQANEGRLRRLLENLFRNAVEHGGEAVTISVGGLPGGFFVEDDGPGIPADEREEVLEAGYSSSQDGTGLGLSIVAAIAEAHGWRLSVAEGRKGGARFEITGVDWETGVRVG